MRPFLYSSCKIDGCRTGFTTKQCLQFHYRKAHGLTDEQMPKIEREIPYTLSAYSGGLFKDDDRARGGGDNNGEEEDKAGRRGRGAAAKRYGVNAAR